MPPWRHAANRTAANRWRGRLRPAGGHRPVPPDGDGGGHARRIELPRSASGPPRRHLRRVHLLRHGRREAVRAGGFRSRRGSGACRRRRAIRGTAHRVARRPPSAPIRIAAAVPAARLSADLIALLRHVRRLSARAPGFDAGSRAAEPPFPRTGTVVGTVPGGQRMSPRTRGNTGTITCTLLFPGATRPVSRPV